jgi:hypothetical protein
VRDDVEVEELVDDAGLLGEAEAEHGEEEHVCEFGLGLGERGGEAEGRVGHVAGLPGREQQQRVEAGLLRAVDVQHEVGLEQGDQVAALVVGEDELQPQQFVGVGAQRQQAQVEPAQQFAGEGQQQHHEEAVVGEVQVVAGLGESQRHYFEEGGGGGDDHAFEEVDLAEEEEEEDEVDEEEGVVPAEGVGGEHVRGEEGEDDDVADHRPVVGEPLRVGVVVLQLDVAVPLPPLQQLLELLVVAQPDYRPPPLAALNQHCLLLRHCPHSILRAHSREGVAQRCPHYGQQQMHRFFPRHEYDFVDFPEVGEDVGVVLARVVVAGGDLLQCFPEELDAVDGVEDEHCLVEPVSLPLHDAIATALHFRAASLWTI